MIALGWTVSLTSAYFVRSVTGLIIIRVMLGFFEGGTYGLAITHLAKWFAAGTRGTVYAIMGSGVIFGSYLTAPVFSSVHPQLMDGGIRLPCLAS